MPMTPDEGLDEEVSASMTPPQKSGLPKLVPLKYANLDILFSEEKR